MSEEESKQDKQDQPLDATLKDSPPSPPPSPEAAKAAEQDYRTAAEEHRDARHASDYPGREYPDEGSPERDHFSSHAERSHSSGASNPSEPRRPGMGERQAPLRSGPEVEDATPIIPGEILMAQDDVVINEGLETTTLRVANTADRPIQVGSHFHFAEVNAALEFDRDDAWGKRLNVLSGGAVRFEPGAVAEVQLVPIRGRRIVRGLRGLCKGALDG